MKLQEFLVELNGKYCEVAGSVNAKFQCVDLANAYIRDVLGFPIIEWTNARDFPSKAGDKYLWIENTPDGIPCEGDLVVWKNTTAGHIAIFIEGDANKFLSFDQNYPIGSPCHIQSHTYTGVSGWLRPILISQNMTQEEQNILKFLNEKGATEGMVREAFGALADISNIKKDLEALKKSQEDLALEVENLRTAIKQKDEDISVVTQELESLKVENQNLQKDIDYYKPYKGRYEEALLKVPNSMTGLELIFVGIKKLLSSIKKK